VVDCPPDLTKIDIVVAVDDAIAHAGDGLPRNFAVSLPKSVGDAFGGFSKNEKLV